MECDRSYLMDGCAVMAPARRRLPAFITPPPALSSCNQNNLGARKSEMGEVATSDDESAHALSDHPLASARVVAVAFVTVGQRCLNLSSVAWSM
jgi:hypothetical protein